jgi:hypothetical protein
VSSKKKLVLSAFVVAAMLAVVGAGTFATFNAQASNGGNLFADGTLVLSNKVGTATACLPTGGVQHRHHLPGPYDTTMRVRPATPRRRTPSPSRTAATPSR